MPAGGNFYEQIREPTGESLCPIVSIAICSRGFVYHQRPRDSYYYDGRLRCAVLPGLLAYDTKAEAVGAGLER
jgi:hypothetical protein